MTVSTRTTRVRRATLSCYALAMVGLLADSSLRTPAGEQEPQYAIKEKVHLVLVPVTVKDKQGDLIDDLTQADFRVFEEGHERPVQFFSNESAPLSTVILLDSGMPEGSAAAVHEALRSLGSSFGPNDEEALYIFDNTIRLVEDFTSQTDLWTELGKKALPAGSGPSLIGGPLGLPPSVNGTSVDRPGTAPTLAPPVRKRIYDALYTGAQRLKSRPRDHRRVIVIVSDGVNGSDNEFSYDDALSALAVSDVVVYAVSLGNGWAAKRADLLGRVTHQTGGDIAYVQRHKSLERAFLGLTNEARNSYVLGFAPASADGRFHEIHVRVKRSGVSLIARNRFFAPPER